MTAATTSLVGAMTTSAWQTLRGRVAALFGRDREADVTAELETIREEVEADGDDAAARVWVRRALRENPELEAMLRQLLTEGQPQQINVRINTISGGQHGTTIMAGTINGNITK
ncbi:hypothetical protein ACFQ0T_05945 [Kitasatospora gansuensis]